MNRKYMQCLFFSLVKARRLIVFSFQSFSHSKLYHYISHLKLETLVICEGCNGIDQYSDIGIKYTVRQYVPVRFQIYDLFFMHLYCLLNEMDSKIVKNEMISVVCEKPAHIKCTYKSALSIPGIPTVFILYSRDSHSIPRNPAFPP